MCTKCMRMDCYKEVLGTASKIFYRNPAPPLIMETLGPIKNCLHFKSTRNTSRAYNRNLEIFGVIKLIRYHLLIVVVQRREHMNQGFRTRKMPPPPRPGTIPKYQAL